MGATTGGCWTCRIRHRKCDETRPVCRECDTRGITCHGYGGKPQWMQDDALLQKELAKTKKAVKDNFRRVKRLHAKRIADEESSARESSQDDTTTTVDTTTDGTVTFTTTSDSLVSQEASYRESELAAYYLDYLFPFLYPYYKCDPLNGGRGWLFWLLSHNPPLRKAALSVAALHQRASSRPEDRDDETELLLYHTSALSGLRQALCITGERYLTDDPDEFIKLLACGCSLISFEVRSDSFLILGTLLTIPQVCHGESNEWQGHLAALVSVACEITPYTFASATLSNNTVTGKSNGATNLRQGRRRALSFLMAQVLWFELLASASTGLRPRMPYRTWLNSGCVDMTDVMGCENWIMEVIGDLATLDAQRTCLELDEFGESRRSAERCLLDGIEAMRRQRTRVGPVPADPDMRTNERLECSTSEYVSLAFAESALVWCRFLAASPDGLLSAGCEAAVAQAVETLSRAPESTPLRGLVWPICIAGSLASKGQQHLVHEIMDRTSRQANTSFGNCGPVMDIIRHCWEAQVDWRTAMAYSSNYVLLI
jgi:hypothetical protein